MTNAQRIIESQDFLQGECGTFAYALSQRFGYPIYALTDDGAVVHAFCLAKGRMIDASGVSDPMTVADVQGAVGEVALRPFTPAELEEERGAVEDVTDTAAALALIDANPQRYQV